ncbi:hypothetical protein B0E38_04736 [Streptomyces sp. 111WW2]|nr:hypothetical protein [Streptomyces sp. 111WW2]PSK52410.1 hypothetical protein B0E38_04736 [Streptomyces sp. 111WW2]
MIWRRFCWGVAGGSVAGGVTYAIPPVSEHWWYVALFVAVLIWFGLDIS